MTGEATDPHEHSELHGAVPQCTPPVSEQERGVARDRVRAFATALADLLAADFQRRPPNSPTK